VVLSALLVLPSVLFVTANVLKNELGVGGSSTVLATLADPQDVGNGVITAVVLVGPVLALAVILVPILRLRLGRSRDVVEVTVTIRVRWGNLAVAGAAGLMLAILGGYLLVENVDCWFGPSVVC